MSAVRVARSTGAAVVAVVALEVAFAYLGFDRTHPTLVVGGVLLAALLSWCISRPAAALVSLMGLWGAAHTYLSNQPLGAAGSIELSISKVVGVTIVVGFGVALLGTKLVVRRAQPYALRALWLFAALYLFEEVRSPSHAAGLSDLLKVASGVVLAAAAYEFIDSEGRLLRLSRLVGLSGVVVALVALLQFALLTVDPGAARALFGSSFYLVTRAGSGDFAYRVSGTTVDAAETAGFLLVCAAFALLRYGLLRERERARGALAVLLIVLVGIAVTVTRTGVAGAVILLGVWALLWRGQAISRTGLRVRLVVGLAVALVGAIQILGPNAIAARIQDLNPSSGASFGNGRGAIWSNELRTLRNGTPATVLLGAGAHSSITTVLEPPKNTPRAFPPHDLVLWLAIESGLVGLILYGSAILSLTKTLASRARAADITTGSHVAVVGLAGTLAFMFHSLFHNTQVSTGSGWYFMLFAGATLRMSTRDGDR